MKLFTLILFCVLCAGTGLAQALRYDEAPDSIAVWLETRVANAAEGNREVVEMPFVVRSLAWGCLCPDHYIGVGTGVQEGPFIHPKVPKKFPKSNENGHSLIVRGYFTGEYVEEDFRNENGEPAEWLYIIPEFVVTEWEVNKLEYEVPFPCILKTGK